MLRHQPREGREQIPTGMVGQFLPEFVQADRATMTAWVGGAPSRALRRRIAVLLGSIACVSGSIVPAPTTL
jgi:hypothetical protein